MFFEDFLDVKHSNQNEISWSIVFETYKDIEYEWSIDYAAVLVSAMKRVRKLNTR